MKRLLFSILAVLYLGVSSGANVYFHHCMGQLVEWGLASTKSEESSKCGKCGMSSDAENDCCKHQTKEVKVDKVQKAAENNFQFKVFATELQVMAFDPGILTGSSITEAHPLLNSPPGIADTQRYLHVCNFRI